MAATIWTVCALEAPVSGRSLAISTSGVPTPEEPPSHPPVARNWRASATEPVASASIPMTSAMSNACAVSRAPFGRTRAVAGAGCRDPRANLRPAIGAALDPLDAIAKTEVIGVLVSHGHPSG